MYKIKTDRKQVINNHPSGITLPVVCIQGLGFVGAAMATAVAIAIDEEGNPIYNVIGVDLPNELGLARVDAINNGEFPFATSDDKLVSAILNVVSTKCDMSLRSFRIYVNLNKLFLLLYASFGVCTSSIV